MSRVKMSGVKLRESCFDSGAAKKYTTFHWQPATGSPVTGATLVTDYLHEKYVGYDLPDYHKRRNAGELLPMMYYENISSALNISVGEWAVTNKHGQTGYIVEDKFLRVRDFEYYMNGTEVTAGEIFADSLGIDFRSDVQMAAAKAYGNGWDALTFFAEFHQIVNMFNGALNTFLNLINPYKDFSALANAYLSYRYGWRILAYDLEQIIDTIWDFNFRLEKHRVKEMSGRREPYTASSTETYYAQDPNGLCSVDVTVDESLSTYGSMVADWTPPRIQVDPLQTAWEVTKFSFVVDWFWNVGRALNAFAVTSLAEAYTSCYSFEYNRTITVDNAQVTNVPPGPTVHFEQASVFNCTVKKRVPCSVPFLPSFKPRLKLEKIVDMIALLNQLVAKAGRKGLRI